MVLGAIVEQSIFYGSGLIKWRARGWVLAATCCGCLCLQLSGQFCSSLCPRSSRHVRVATK